MVATIADIDEEERIFLLELKEAAKTNGVVYHRAVATIRTPTVFSDTLLRNEYLGCGVTMVPNDKFDPKKPFDISWWRGGAAVITSLRLLSCL